MQRWPWRSAASCSGFRGLTTYYYWMALAPVCGFARILSGWRKADQTAELRSAYVATQAPHWLAFLGAMSLMLHAGGLAALATSQCDEVSRS